MGPNRPGRGAHVATASFMVDGAARGAGVGRALGEHMLAWATQEGLPGGPVQRRRRDEHGCRAALASLGFRIIGTVPEAFDSRAHGLVGLHVMHRYL